MKLYYKYGKKLKLYKVLILMFGEKIMRGLGLILIKEKQKICMAGK